MSEAGQGAAGAAAAPAQGQPGEAEAVQQQKPDGAAEIVATAASTATYYASICPGPEAPLPDEFVKLVKKLEEALQTSLWLLIQNGQGRFSNIDYRTFKGFQTVRHEISEGGAVGLLMESPGGDAHYAYQIARLFQRRTNNFTAVIPQYAKSAATLLALGAASIVLGRDAEIGPLDVQVFDPEREDIGSALNAVQALERLHAFSLVSVDQAMQLMLIRAGKKVETLLPLILNYEVSFLRPLLEGIDAVDFTKKSRELKVAEEYAFRLMKKNYAIGAAKRIARDLVEKYPAHEFIIDLQEAETHEQIAQPGPGQSETFGLGLKIVTASAEAQEIMEKLVPFLDKLTVIGRLKEVQP